MQMDTRSRRLGLLVALAVLTGACGEDAPAAPSSPYPNVAGRYSGTVTITYTSLGQSLTCPATTTTTQSGANVTIAPITLSGACSSVSPSLPFGDVTISTTGSLGNATVNNIAVASCGGAY